MKGVFLNYERDLIFKKQEIYDSFNFKNKIEGGYHSSAIILYFQNKILLQKRDEFTEYHPLKWSLFGGGIDLGESPLQAAIRECDEELGFKPNNLDFLGIRFRHKLPLSLEYFFSKKIDSFQKESLVLNEGKDMAWFNEKEILGLNLVPFYKPRMSMIFQKLNELY